MSMRFAIAAPALASLHRGMEARAALRAAKPRAARSCAAVVNASGSRVEALREKIALLSSEREAAGTDAMSAIAEVRRLSESLELLKAHVVRVDI